MIAPDLLEIMACPDCHGPLREEESVPALVCEECGLHFPITDGIPVMLLEMAYRPGDG